LIGQASSTKRIMTKEAFDSGRIQYASQDGSREFISLLACINATGAALPPTLIYKGDSKDLQDTWIEDFDLTTTAYFSTSSNGWSCDAFGRQWLKSVFNCHTDKGSRVRRLLIVDGHSSHVNMDFINLCDDLRIILLILPPHSTHRLQPLDVSLFAPLASFYTNGLNQLMFNSLGMVSMSKRAFWSIFWPAWQSAFSENNILSGFRKTGIWPINPDIILSKIIKATPETTPDKPKSYQTPMTSKAIRRAQRAFNNTSDPAILNKIFTANERLASQHSVDKHVIQGLIYTLKNEKKKRQRGKRLNLLNEESSGPQLFSPQRIQKAREVQGQKEIIEAQRQQDLIDKKAVAATKKAQKAADKIQRDLQASFRRQVAIEAEKQKAQEKQAQKESRKRLATPQKKQSNRFKASTDHDTRPVMSHNRIAIPKSTVAVVTVNEPVLATSRGRRICRPQRFVL